MVLTIGNKSLDSITEDDINSMLDNVEDNIEVIPSDDLALIGYGNLEV